MLTRRYCSCATNTLITTGQGFGCVCAHVYSLSLTHNKKSCLCIRLWSAPPETRLSDISQLFGAEDKCDQENINALQNLLRDINFDQWEYLFAAGWLCNALFQNFTSVLKLKELLIYNYLKLQQKM